MMIEIFTKLPLKIYKFWLLYRQAVQNSLKNVISLVHQGQGKNKQMFVVNSFSLNKLLMHKVKIKYVAYSC